MKLSLPFLALAALGAAIPGWAEEITDLTMLVGIQVDLQLQAGKQISEAEVTKVAAGDSAGSIRSLSVKPAGSQRIQTVAASGVAEIFVAGRPLDVIYDKRTRTLSHSPVKREARLKHEAEVNERLAAQRQRLWPELTPQEHEEWIAKHKAFVEEVKQKMGGKSLALVETKYYLFYTDMSPQKVGIYIAYLDAMYEELCKAFSIPAGKNIWCGKCVVVAFAEEGSFRTLESVVFDNPGAMAQGICHSSSDGRVVISCWKGDHEAFFANVLVHETAHGFIHRWKSTVHIPSWVNEGIADWVANAVVKDGEVPRRQKSSVERVRQTGSLGGTFFDESRNIESWQYGVASTLVEMLLRKDAARYRTLLTAIKEGHSSTDALQQAYGLSPEELILAYGRLAGVPNLRP